MNKSKVFLQNLNWERDQGIQLIMINGVQPPGRNQFYDQILKHNVKDRRCLEIGFGTGILSMLALKHGAEHIEAWEQDFNRYQLGCHIIQQLDLESKITLNFGQYDKQQYTDRDRVIFHEIIGPNVWNEGLWYALPWHADLVLPGVINVELEVIALDINTYKTAFLTTRPFQPGVELDKKFINLVQELIDQTPQKNHFRECLDSNNIENEYLYTLPFYRIDCNNKTINSNTVDSLPVEFYKQYTFEFDSDKVLLVYPLIVLEHQDKTLHWTWYKPIVITHSGIYDIKHNFQTGDFTNHRVV